MTSTPASPVPVVGQREPCPCGSGRRYKACHGRPARAGVQADRAPAVARPFAGRADEGDWVALREVVPAATAPVRLAADPAARVTVATVLPGALPALHRVDGEILLGLQVPARSGDLSRDLAQALEAALAAEPGNPVGELPVPGPGPRLQDLLDPAPMAVTVHDGFGFWLGDETPSAQVAADIEAAAAAVVPTVRLTAAPAAYWCRMAETRCHLRWAVAEDEDRALDALARLHAAGALTLGEGTKYAGAFRTAGILVPVWDTPHDAPDAEAAAALEAPLGAVSAALAEALATAGPLTPAERRSRAGLIGRQLTLR